MDLILRDCRISKKYVEFDTTIPKSNLDELIEKLSSIGPLDHAKHVLKKLLKKKKPFLKEFHISIMKDFGNAMKFLKVSWKNCDGNEKFLVQGLILVAAGLVHYQKDEDAICISIFNRALEKLENSNGQYYNIDIDKIKKTVTEMINSKDVSSFLI